MWCESIPNMWWDVNSVRSNTIKYNALLHHVPSHQRNAQNNKKNHELEFDLDIDGGDIAYHSSTKSNIPRK